MSNDDRDQSGHDVPWGDHVPNGAEQARADDRDRSEHAGTSAASRAHGTHGKGGSEEELLDEQATDTGDDAQLRTAGGGGDRAPSPQKFRENAEGRMGGAGWGSEAAGGSVVDRRPPDQDTGKQRGHA